MDISRVRRLAKEGAWVIVGQLATVTGSLALIRVLTEYLDPRQYGQLALGLTVTGLVNQVVMGGIAAGVGRYYSIASERKQLHGYFRDVSRLLGYGSLAVGVIGIILISALLWLDYKQWVQLAALTMLFAVITAYSNSINQIQNAARQRSIVALHSGLGAWLKIVLALAAIVWLNASAASVVIGYLSASIFITVSQLYFLRRTMPSRGNQASYQSLLSPICAYAWPFSIWGIFTWILQISDRWSLAVFGSTEDVGRYAVLFQLGYAPMMLLLGMLTAFLGPVLYQRAGDGESPSRNARVHRLSWHVTSAALLITFISFVIVLLVKDWIVQTLVAEEYRQISDLLPWVVLAGGLFGASQMIALKLMTEIKSIKLLVPKVGTALLGTSFNLMGAMLGGVRGVVVALVAFSLVCLIWMAFLGKDRQSGIQLSEGQT